MKIATKCLTHKGWVVSMKPIPKATYNGCLIKNQFPSVKILIQSITACEFPHVSNDLYITDRLAEPINDKILGVFLISAETETEVSLLSEYIQYFYNSKKCGIIKLGVFEGVIVIKGSLSENYYPEMEENQALLLLVKREISSSMKLLQEVLEKSNFL